MLKEISLKLSIFKQDITGYSFFKNMILSHQLFKKLNEYYFSLNKIINFYLNSPSEKINIKEVSLFYFLDYELKKSLKDNYDNKLFSFHIDRIKKCLRKLFQELEPWQKRSHFIHDILFGIGLVADKQKPKDILFKIIGFYFEQKVDIELVFGIEIEIERFLENFNEFNQLKASQYHFFEIYQTCLNLYNENEKVCSKPYMKNF